MFVGDKAFYKRVVALAMPIMIQSGITSFVGLLDNIMVGQVGTEQMAGVAIVNQIMFVFYLALFGMTSGAGIFVAQFHGKKDIEGIRQTFRYKILFAFLLSSVGIGLMLAIPRQLIGIFLNGNSTVGDLNATLLYAQDYLHIAVWGLLPFALSQAYATTLRETEHTVLPMTAGFVAVGLNCLGNYLLIFGIGALPTLGVQGAAISTVASRVVELGILIVATRMRKVQNPFIVGAWRRLFAIDRALLGSIVRKATPLFVNETLWSAGISALVQCYSLRGLAVVAALNIATTVNDVFGIVFISLGSTVGIVVGKYLGADDNEGALDAARKMIFLSGVVGVAIGLVQGATAWLFPRLYNTQPEVRTMAAKLLLVLAGIYPIRALCNAFYFTLRSGGKTFITFLFDSTFVCCICVPVAYLLVYLTDLDIVSIYAIDEFLYVLEIVIGATLVHKRIWLNKIV